VYFIKILNFLYINVLVIIKYHHVDYCETSLVGPTVALLDVISSSNETLSTRWHPLSSKYGNISLSNSVDGSTNEYPFYLGLILIKQTTQENCTQNY